MGGAGDALPAVLSPRGRAEGARTVLFDGTSTGGVPFLAPLGLASDGDTLYVGDWATGTVWAVDGAGARILAGDLAFPGGMVVDGDRLLVAETGRGQATEIGLATGAATPVIVGLAYSDRVPEGFIPVGIMSGVGVADPRKLCGRRTEPCRLVSGSEVPRSRDRGRGSDSCSAHSSRCRRRPSSLSNRMKPAIGDTVRIDGHC